MSKFHKYSILAIVAVLSMTATSDAAPIALTNAGFELPALADGTASVVGNIPGWVQVGDGDDGVTAGSGPYNPLDGQFANATGDILPLPAPGGGFQVGLINDATATFSGLGQAVGTLSADTVYTFTAALGSRIDIASRPWPLMDMYIMAGDPDPTVGTVLATLDVLTSGNLPGAGAFVNNSVVLDSSTVAGNVGDNLFITITSADDPNESAKENQPEWDNVTLDASPVPEPTSFVLFGLSSLAMLCWRRRSH